MTKTILIDIGSSTVKVYKWNGKSLSPILTKSISFKKDFDPKVGILQSSKKELYKIINFVKTKNKNIPIKIYATAIFRKFEKEALKNFKTEFYEKTGVNFNVITQEEENLYLELALVGKYKGREKVLLINIGGGSTELVVTNGKKAIETKNIDLGVGNILSKFPKINDGINNVSIEKVKEYVNKKLPGLRNKVEIAIYSGGELTYMKAAGYNLKLNKLFKDSDHPFIISLSDFSKRNKEIFEKVYVKDLEKLMPQNPTWMHGARACSALAEAVCEKYKVETIIPSDSNLINGVVRKDF